MKNEEFISDLKTYIKARYPLLLIETDEEDRLIEDLEKLSTELDYNLITWNACTSFESQTYDLDDEDFSDFGSAIIKCNGLSRTGERFLFVFKVKNENLNKESRLLKEIAIAIRTDSKYCCNYIFISSYFEDIDKTIYSEVAILDYPLLDKQEIKEKISETLQSWKQIYPQNVKIEQSDKLIETMANASLGLTSIAIDNCMAKSLVKYGGIVDQNCPKSILLEKKQILRKSGILEYIENNLSLEDVGGLNVLKKWLELRGNSFSDEARLFGLNPPKGVLLVGIPGCGKSLTAKCVASSWNMPLLKFDVGKIFGRWLGESEANMREALKVAEATAPCVLWIDEIEKGLQQNEHDDGGTTRRVFGNILSWMQDKIAAVFVFATANNIKTLPPEFLRKGRFDEIFFVDLPSIEERKKIIEIHLKNTKRNLKNFDIEKLAQLSGEENLGKNVRLSGAEIEAWIKDSLLEAYSRKINGDKKADLSMNDLEAVIKRIIPMAKMRVDDFRELRSWARNNAVSASNISNTLNSFKKSF